jgi:hypothetical protein
MENDARAIARAVGRELARSTGVSNTRVAPGPTPAPLPASEDDERPDVFMAINGLFELQEQRIDELERRIAALEAAKPAARAVEHIRDASGAIIRSVLIEDPAP